MAPSNAAPPTPIELQQLGEDAHLVPALPTMDRTRGPPNFFPNKPYLTSLFKLQTSYPVLKPFLRKLGNKNDEGRKVVKKHFEEVHKRTPGRCVCLVFNEKTVTPLSGYESGFSSAPKLEEYLTAEDGLAKQSRKKGVRRLFILEDMEPEFVEILGYHLGVDPLVFSEQMNTLNYADSWSIQNRGLPSMHVPTRSFTLRYYELRTLKLPSSIDALTLQMTFAVNRRRYERWRDVDVPSAGKPDRRHGFVRRAASFWTSQDLDPADSNQGWDAVILVDPGMAAACLNPRINDFILGRSSSPPAVAHDPVANGARVGETVVTGVPPTKRSMRPRVQRAGSITGDAPADDSEEEWPPARKTLILSDKRTYISRASLWKAQDWKKSSKLHQVEHESWPYHDGCSTLFRLDPTRVGIDAADNSLKDLEAFRDLASPLDEMVHYWTKFAASKHVEETHSSSCNAASFLLKNIAQHWVSQLELINTTISKGEWFSDDYQAKIDDELSLQKLRQELKMMNQVEKDITYMQRHLNHFWRAMIANLERIGVQLGDEALDPDVPGAIKGAQKDFIALNHRMQPLRERATALSTAVHEISNRRAAFRGVHDGEFSVRFGLFASVVFPLTLLASIFSMSDNYLPGARHHWELWAIGVPICIVLALVLIYGWHVWKVFPDLVDGAKNGVKEVKEWWIWTKARIADRKAQKAAEEYQKEHAAAATTTNGSSTSIRRASRQADEEQAVAGAQRGVQGEGLVRRL